MTPPPDASKRERKRDDPYRCCKIWSDELATRRAKWEYQALHQLSHSRVPFSRQTFQALANVPDDQVDELIHYGETMRWIRRYGDETYLGRLTKRR